MIASHEELRDSEEVLYHLLLSYHDVNILIDRKSSFLLDGGKVKQLSTGYKFTEGPVWDASEGCLLFSDIPANRIYRWTPGGSAKIFREPSGNSNGLTLDMSGNLITCEHGTRRIGKVDRDGNYTVIAETYGGRRLNSPNDAVVKSDGSIYFTDPPYGITPEEQELLSQGVYRLEAEKKEPTLLVDDFERPNGLTFSPDEKTLYIADSSDRRHVRAFNVENDGTLTDGRVFAEIRSELPGNPDGMKVDVEGNLYVATAGIWVFSEEGKHLGIIKIPEIPANLAWGGKDWKTLYITARTSLYCVKTKVEGTYPV
ncbi:MAG: SMP-30/gluconolactonase/LRE family protein [Candidatus Bathyarchaeota archaeon]|jgi:gluconolactonase|nr:SMP-30/gluconolactonase/LRE family protein [Candidatus Bathyarchaeota archaeon]